MAKFTARQLQYRLSVLQTVENAKEPSSSSQRALIKSLFNISYDLQGEFYDISRIMMGIPSGYIGTVLEAPLVQLVATYPAGRIPIDVQATRVSRTPETTKAKKPINQVSRLKTVDDLYVCNVFQEPDYSSTVQALIDCGRPVMLVGPNGIGKTKLFQFLADKKEQKVFRLNFDGEVTPELMMGGVRVRKVRQGDTVSSETFFQEGVIPTAMKEGGLLILDEVDKSQPEYIVALHAILENIRNPLILVDDGGRVVTPHEDFRIVATANTLGNPEDRMSGYFSNVMNKAFQDRFSIMQVGYPSTSVEVSIVSSVCGNKELSKKIVKVAHLSRDAASTGDLTNFDFSTRRLVNWAFFFCVLGDFSKAILAEVTGRLSVANQRLVVSFIHNIFGEEWKTMKATYLDIE